MKCEYCKKETKQMNLIRSKWTCYECSDTYNNKDLIDVTGKNRPFKTSEPVSNINPTHYTDFAIPPNEYITANKLEWEVGKHPLINSDSTHYQMVDGIESIVLMESIFSVSELMAWAKITSYKYRFRLGKKDDNSKDIKKMQTYEAYYKALSGKMV